ncbi:MAG: YbhB/YbcL family Raf kinase inhibitor-like protein [Comamonadaceae bacterium]|nr:MAG: YbhB/YbcL family Raf kinase inhibitor-like protein [Comamonadaceae bacterium]
MGGEQNRNPHRICFAKRTRTFTQPATPLNKPLENPTKPDGASRPFNLSSQAFEPGAVAGERYHGERFGCSGGNTMPPLSWDEAPAGAKSFAVTLHDLDAPTGSGFWHWVAYDLPAATTGLPGGKDGTVLPGGAKEGNTDLGTPGFFGPCPPPGRQHRYVYTVHALDVTHLPAAADDSPAMVGFIIWQHELARATLMFKVGPR